MSSKRVLFAQKTYVDEKVEKPFDGLPGTCVGRSDFVQALAEDISNSLIDMRRTAHRKQT